MTLRHKDGINPLGVVGSLSRDTRTQRPNDAMTPVDAQRYGVKSLSLTKGAGRKENNSAEHGPQERVVGRFSIVSKEAKGEHS